MDTTQTVIQTSLTTENLPTQEYSVLWVYATIFLSVVVVLLLLSLFKSPSRNRPTEKERIKAQVLGETPIDMGNVIKSTFQAKPLYDRLKIVCHPDRFVHNNELRQKAETLFQEISQHKYDYKKLTELQQIAINTLNIKI